LPLFLAYGIKTVYPEFEVKDMLNDRALPLYQQIGQVCSETGAVQKPSAAAILKPNWESNKFVQKYFGPESPRSETRQRPAARDQR
jgi:hypothetical protein